MTTKTTTKTFLNAKTELEKSREEYNELKSHGDNRPLSANEIKRINEIAKSIPELRERAAKQDETNKMLKSLHEPVNSSFIDNENYSGVVSPGLHKSTEQFRLSIKMAMQDDGMGNVTKSLISGNPVAFDYSAMPVTLPEQSSFISSLLHSVAVGVPSGMYLRETPHTGVTATTVPREQEKPVMDLSLTPVQWNIATVAVLSQQMPLQYFADYNELGEFIFDRLAFDVQHAIDNLVLSGGTDENGDKFDGLLTDSDVQAISYRNSPMSTVRDAIESLQEGFVEPTSVVLAPSDWKAIEDEADTIGRPLLNAQPNGATLRSIYGIPVTVCSSLAPGTALVGDPATAATLLIRQQAGSVMWIAAANTSTAGDMFAKNLGQMRYEGRYGLTITQPSALRTVSLAAASK